MSYTISVAGTSLPTERAAVVAAFNALVSALHTGCPGEDVDAGGTFIDDVRYFADEGTPGRPQGAPF
jgi:hypothetical protein